MLGPPQVGKTALIHEYVFRRVQEQRRTEMSKDEKRVWLLAPARLISGMSYVGQWEDRLLAIIKHARKREHLLYFDDLLGLFQAGQTSQSSLSVADVLRPYLERSSIRVVAEITPAAWRVLRERDRAFADLFYVLPVTEPNEADLLRILIGVQRQLEGQLRCRFDLDVVPAVLDLQRRYGRDAVFPGKAATFLKQLAVKYRGGDITRARALEEFRVRSGLALAFVDCQSKLARSDVVKSLEQQVIGQPEALQAAADVIAIAKARLNDTGRPLAAFLLLGPTGVGKTQCAKAIASYLFGDADRLLRFDLNEFGTPGSAARLVGTAHQPEGLLTSAVRRQPFSVVLFDEVEKADPEVFDLLLQVLGEGRLTDALGRTADFTSTFIVLTSNLGVRESESGLGYRADPAAGEQFVRAAERFFRPEFFNRIDRILPFRRLERGHVRSIARKLLGEVFAREGLVQRKCLLSVEDAALEWLVDQGYDPVLGARALKRTLEKNLTQPLSAQLAAQPWQGFTQVQTFAGPEQLLVHAQQLEQAKPLPGLDLPRLPVAELLGRLRQCVRRIEDQIASLRPEGAITLGQVSPAQLRYFTIKEQIQRIRDVLRRLEDRLDGGPRRLPSLSTAPVSFNPRAIMRAALMRDIEIGGLLRQIASALDIPEYLREVVEAAEPLSTQTHGPELLELCGQASLLQLMARSLQSPTAERALLWLRWPGADPHSAVSRIFSLGDMLGSTLELALSRLHLDVAHWQPAGKERFNMDDFLLVHGLHAWPLASPITTCVTPGCPAGCSATKICSMSSNCGPILPAR